MEDSENQEKLNMNTTATTEFKVWKTVKLGELTDEKLWEKLRNNQPYCHGAFDVIKSDDFQVSRKKVELDIVTPTCTELGLPVLSSYPEICKRAKDFGLELCHEEASIWLWLQNDRSVGERTVVGTKSIGGEVLMVVRGWYARGFYKIFTANSLTSLALERGFEYSQKEAAERGREMMFAFVKPRKQETAE